MNYTICCIKECENSVLALGLCNKHWQRNRKFGSPVATQSHSGLFRGLLAPERFEKQVQKSDGCWLWTGGKDKDGYGIFRGEVGGVLFKKAHRYSYALHTGDLLVGMQALHSCDNPSCVNPAHLSSGTNADNMRDKVTKGRHRAPAGENHYRAILTEEQAAAVLIDPRPNTVIAAEYNVTAATVRDIKSRFSWRHLEGEAVKHERVGKPGESCYAAKLTEQDVLDIRASTDTGKSLALKYGVSPQSITDIRKRRSWKHI